jgi:uncharacterized protein (TIGR02145 family)
MTRLNKKVIIGGSVFLLFLFVLIFIKSRSSDAPIHVFAETVSASQIRLFWQKSDEATQYNIYRAENREGEYLRVGFSLDNEHLDENLKPATTYYYRVTKIVDFKESQKSMIVSVKTGPAVPSNLRAVAASFQEDLRLRVDLFWDYSVGAEKYFVYRSMDEAGVYQKIGESLNENYSDFDLLPKTSYYYVVTQITEGEEGAYSNEASVATDSFWSCGEGLEYGEESYETIRIGNRCWFRRNLNVVSGETHRDCEIEKHCYNNDLRMCSIYGGLYNFASISCRQTLEGMQGICPVGWRIPTDDDWIMLETEIGMREGEIKKYGYRGTDEGSKLAGRYDLWKNGPLKYSGSFALSEFNALPGGYQPGFNIRLFYNISESAIFWSSTRLNDDSECTFFEPAYAIREINYNETRIRRDCYSRIGTAYVRCVRDY